MGNWGRRYGEGDWDDEEAAGHQERLAELEAQAEEGIIYTRILAETHKAIQFLFDEPGERFGARWIPRSQINGHTPSEKWVCVSAWLREQEDMW